MANDPRQLAGSIDAAAAEKMTRFVDLCDTFHLPVVNFVDNPGFLIGVEAEKRGTIRRGVRALVRRLPGDACPGARSSCARSSAWPAPATARTTA